MRVAVAFPWSKLIRGGRKGSIASGRDQMGKTRRVKDSMGEVSIPDHALYGAQTRRAMDNFPVSGTPMPAAFIRAAARIKESAARVNRDLGLLEQDMADAIIAACEAIIAGNHIDQFPVDVYQTGSGTSTNMNVNEVVATLAGKQLGREVHPNDHVNLGQSSNDVIPTAIHVSAAVALRDDLLPALEHLQSRIEEKARGLEDCVKTGRTHLMDAVPLTMAQEMSAWAGQVGQQREWLQQGLDDLCDLAQGGTAVGTGINTHAEFARRFAEALAAQTGLPLRPAANLYTAISSQDTAVAVSGRLKSLAVVLTKISNDLRWMNSGPLAGLGEIVLETLQPGSSIMPGKVNPVIPEAVLMAAARVIGNDTTVAIAGQAGNFQLNTMLPLIADVLLQGMELLSNSCRLLADRAIATFEVRHDNIRRNLERNPILATALNPYIGYAAAAKIARQAYEEQRPVIDVAAEQTDLTRDQLETILDPLKLVRGGFAGKN